MASILLASQGQLTIACGLIFLAAVFDVFDGLAARALGGGTPLGAQLDSLADMVSFGVAPAFLMFQASAWAAASVTPPDGWIIYPPLSELGMAPESAIGLFKTWSWMSFSAAVILVVSSCWRLAKFNLDTRQTSGFLGLPTPSNGLFWVSVVMVSEENWLHRGPGQDLLVQGVHTLMGHHPALLAASLVLALLMLSELPLPSLKFKHKGWKGNEVIFLLIGIGAVLVLLYGVLAVPLILIIYLLSPLWGKLFPKHPA